MVLSRNKEAMEYYDKALKWLPRTAVDLRHRDDARLHALICGATEKLETDETQLQDRFVRGLPGRSKRNETQKKDTGKVSNGATVVSQQMRRREPPAPGWQTCAHPLRALPEGVSAHGLRACERVRLDFGKRQSESDLTEKGLKNRGSRAFRLENGPTRGLAGRIRTAGGRFRGGIGGNGDGGKGLKTAVGCPVGGVPVDRLLRECGLVSALGAGG